MAECGVGVGREAADKRVELARYGFQCLQMSCCIAVAEGVVGHDIETGFDGGVEVFVQGGNIAHGMLSYGF